MDMKKRFEEFLEKKGIRKQFEDNLKADGGFDSLADFTDEIPPHGWLTLAFIWDCAPEGWELWLEVCEEWEGIVDKGES